MRRVLSSLTESILTAHFGPHALEDSRAGIVQSRIHQRISDLIPLHLRLALACLLIVFNGAAVFSYGGLFSHLSIEQRRLYFISWSKSKIELARGFARFFETLILMDWHSLPHGPADAHS